MNQKRLVGTREAASAVGLSPRSIRRLAQQRRLAAIRFSPRGHLRFDVDDLAEAIERARREAE